MWYDKKYEFAEIWRRYFALMIDSALNSILIPIPFNVYFYFTKWQTLGCIAMWTKIVDSELWNAIPSKLFVRFFAKFISRVFLYLWYFSAIYHPENKSWHDRLSWTCVIKTRNIKRTTKKIITSWHYIGWFLPLWFPLLVIAINIKLVSIDEAKIKNYIESEYVKIERLLDVTKIRLIVPSLAESSLYDAEKRLKKINIKLSRKNIPSDSKEKLSWLNYEIVRLKKEIDKLKLWKKISPELDKEIIKSWEKLYPDIEKTKLYKRIINQIDDYK